MPVVNADETGICQLILKALNGFTNLQIFPVNKVYQALPGCLLETKDAVVPEKEYLFAG